MVALQYNINNSTLKEVGRQAASRKVQAVTRRTSWELGSFKWLQKTILPRWIILAFGDMLSLPIPTGKDLIIMYLIMQKSLKFANVNLYALFYTYQWKTASFCLILYLSNTIPAVLTPQELGVFYHIFFVSNR